MAQFSMLANSDELPINILVARDAAIKKYSVSAMLGVLGIFGYKMFSIQIKNNVDITKVSRPNLDDALILAFTALSAFFAVYSAILMCTRALSSEGFIDNKHAFLAIVGFSGIIASMVHLKDSSVFSSYT